MYPRKLDNLPGFNLQIEAGKNQEQFGTLPCMITARGTVISRWTFTNEERLAIANGADIYLSVEQGEFIVAGIMPTLLTLDPDRDQLFLR